MLVETQSSPLFVDRDVRNDVDVVMSSLQKVFESTSGASSSFETEKIHNINERLLGKTIHNSSNYMNNLHRESDNIVILAVNKNVEIFVHIVVSIAVCIQLAFLIAVIINRNHSVLKLSQGSSMMVLLLSSMIATASSFLLNPKNDMYCTLSGPLIFIPLQIMLAIIIARLRRILSIMNPLMSWGGPSEKNLLSVLPTTWLTGDSNNNNNLSKKYRQITSNKKKNIRQQYSHSRLQLVVFAIVLPQVIVQIIGLTAKFRPNLTLFVNDEVTMGRYECGSKDQQNFRYLQYSITFLTVIAVLYESQRSKRLPSMFNESNEIWGAFTSTIVVLALGISIIAVSYRPSSSLDAPYIMGVAIVLTLTLNMSLRISYPKLMLIRRGEKVMLSRMLQDHKIQNKKDIKKSRRRMSTPTETIKACSNKFNDLSVESESDNVMPSQVPVKEIETKQDRGQESESNTAAADRPTNCISEVRDEWGDNDAPCKLDVNDEEQGFDDTRSYHSNASSTLRSDMSYIDTVAKAFRLGVTTKKRWYHLKLYRDVFLGSEAVDFLVNGGYAQTREEGLVLGRQLADECDLFHHVCHDHELEDAAYFYRFFEEKDGDTCNQSTALDEKHHVNNKFLTISQLSNASTDTEMIIDEDHVPPQRIVKNLVQHAEIVNLVSRRQMNGLQVYREDWEQLDKSIRRTYHIFKGVKYDWREKTKQCQLKKMERQRRRNSEPHEPQLSILIENKSKSQADLTQYELYRCMQKYDA